MSQSMNSIRRAVIGAIGAGVVAGGVSLGAPGIAEAAPAPVSVAGPAFDAPARLHAPAPNWGGGRGGLGQGGGGHGGFGRGWHHHRDGFHPWGSW